MSHKVRSQNLNHKIPKSAKDTKRERTAFRAFLCQYRKAGLAKYPPSCFLSAFGTIPLRGTV